MIKDKKTSLSSEMSGRRAVVTVSVSLAAVILGIIALYWWIPAGQPPTKAEAMLAFLRDAGMTGLAAALFVGLPFGMIIVLVRWLHERRRRAHRA